MRYTRAYPSPSASRSRSATKRIPRNSSMFLRVPDAPKPLYGDALMSSVVFILGAGASADCGAPLMSNFLDVAADLYFSKAVEDKKLEFERVLGAIGSL